MFSLRPALADDAAALAALDCLCNPKPWSAGQFQAALDEAHTRVWLAETPAGCAGFIVWQQLFDEAELHLIATAPAQRRQGIATALLAQMFQAAGLRRVFLEVRAGNLAAQALYRRHGFADLVRRRAYYGDEDALVMEKLC